MFKTRLLSGIVLVIAAIFLIVTGNEVLLFSTLLISCIGCTVYCFDFILHQLKVELHT